MKKQLLFLFVISFSFISYSQSKNLIGDWLITKIVKEGKVIEPYQILSLKKDGNLEIMEMPLGSWEYKKKKKEITFNTPRSKKLDGTYQIVAFKKNILTLKKDDTEYYYLRVCSDEITKLNTASKLVGIWKTTDEYGTAYFFKFNLPDSFKEISINEANSSTTSGSWLYIPKEKSFVIIARSELLQGKNKLVSIDENEMKFQNNRKDYLAEKLKDESDKVEKLSFTEEELYDDQQEEEHNESEDEVSTIFTGQWGNTSTMIKTLENIKKLNYRKGEFLTDFGVFNYSNFYIQPILKQEDEKIIFNYYTEDNGESNKIGQRIKERYASDFFPEEDPNAYSIISRDTQVTVPAGTFNCTVIEAVENFDDKVKFYLINDKPGIYAKIVRVKKLFEKEIYEVTELMKIE